MRDKRYIQADIAAIKSLIIQAQSKSKKYKLEKYIKFLEEELEYTKKESSNDNNAAERRRI